MADWKKGLERFQGKQVLVLGAARSGIAAAHLLLQLGAKVVLNDLKLPGEGDRWAEELKAKGARLILGEHPMELLQEQFDAIVKNPGIPYTHPYIREAAARGIPVITEVELGFSILEGVCIGITGSNGKTTTTTLTGEMFSQAGRETIVAGNIGKVFSEQVQRTTPSSVTVAELSSFQLKGTIHFRPKIACLLNLYPHHLDYHGEMEDYVSSKFNLFRNQTEEDFAVLNWDQEEVRALAEKVNSRVYGFSRHQVLSQGAYIYDMEGDRGKESWILFRHPGSDPVKIVPVSEVALIGEHNLENALASVCMAMLGGVDKETIAQVLRSFKGVEHRLEFVAEKRGVKYYNDSKATNPEATSRALASFTQPLILIAGGMERGASFDSLIPFFSERVKVLIAYGQTKHKLEDVARRAGVKEIVLVDNVSEAVVAASGKAKAGDIVLLSPACASWDLYSSFEERGRMFKEAVHSL